MVIETNDPPKMFDILMGLAGCQRNKMFFLKTSSPRFGLKALRVLVQSGVVEMTLVDQGDTVCRLKDKLG